MTIPPKTTMSYYYTPIKLAMIKKNEHTKGSQLCSETGTVLCNDDKKWYRNPKQFSSFLKVKYTPTIQPRHSNQKKQNICPHKDCT